jgi:hypothetical protein
MLNGFLPDLNWLKLHLVSVNIKRTLPDCGFASLGELPEKAPADSGGRPNSVAIAAGRSFCLESEPCDIDTRASSSGELPVPSLFQPDCNGGAGSGKSPLKACFWRPKPVDSLPFFLKPYWNYQT